MADVNQIATWTIDEIRDEIQKILPKEFTFHEEEITGWLVVTISEASDGTILWADKGPLHRTILANAFGWLYLRGKKPNHPVWKARPVDATRRLDVPPPAKVPPPPDLDADEIKRVYEKTRKRT